MSAQNKTEKATPRKKSKARSKGQIPRSKDTVNFVLLVTCSCLFYAMSAKIFKTFGNLLTSSFLIDRNDLRTHFLTLHKAYHLILYSFLLFLPIFLGALAAVYIGSIILGGHLWSAERIKPKITNIKLVGGLKRLFSSKSFIDVGLALFKCTVITLILISILKALYPKLIHLPLMGLDRSMQLSSEFIINTFFTLSLSTIIFCVIDYPYQIYLNTKQLKMTKQEVKDEYKDSEGSPQVKGKIRRLQFQAARRRKMMQNLPRADVLIVNPTHYAVALEYDDEEMDAPVIVGMGADLLALHIRRLCTEYKIPILEIPILARALYNHGELGQKIPEGLFHAVARVIAYIFRLDDPLSFDLDSEWVAQLPIPKELNTDT